MSFVSHFVCPILPSIVARISMEVDEGHASCMEYVADWEMENRLRAFLFGRVGRHLKRREQRECFATYAQGIMSEGERKSVEPIAARATADAVGCSRAHGSILNFLREAPWDDHKVRLEAASYVIDALQAQEKVGVWIIDDTGFPKQGKHSVGVQRQYSGTLGKVGNCQVGVSLSIATRHEHVPIDFELYMPESWTEDAARRKKARVPVDLVFKTKTDLSIDLISRAMDNKIPGEIVLADAAYGGSAEFRNTVEMFGLDVGVAVKGNMKVWLLDAIERRRGEPIEARALGAKFGRGAFRRMSWREGTRRRMVSNFKFCRVKVANDDGTEAADRLPMWLVLEWPDGESQPTKFILTSLRRKMPKKEIVRVLQERWRTERAYEELKGELGLDHFEGRTFTGWHHHISVVLCCYAFIVSERVRHFPPSARWKNQAQSLARAA
jgi:SRSO17 transposase